MRVEEWIKQQKQMFNLEAKSNKGDSEFISREWVITDPRGRGMELRLSENSSGYASLFTTAIFNFPRFNAAEGFSSDFILSVATKILKGDIVVGHSLFLRRPLIQFKDEITRNIALGIVSFRDYATKKDIVQAISYAKAGYAHLKK